MKVPRPFWLVGTSFALLPPIFYLDLVTPNGFAAGILYVIPLVLTLWVARSSDLVALAVLATLLTVAGYFFGAQPVAPLWIMILNRAVSLLAIWGTAIGILLYKRMERTVHEERERSARIERAAQERETLARLGEMAAVVAHEVRNPLAGVIGALTVLSERLSPEHPDRGVMGEICARLGALSAMVRNLLVFARPKMPRLSLQRVRPTIEKAVSLLESDPEFRAVRFDLEGEDGPLEIDPDQIGEVLHNILQNACQATPADGGVRIGIRWDPSRCRITVADRGPGISEEVRMKLFTPFFTTRTRGTGLGLVVAKSIAESHGGTIDVRSLPQGGTEVEIELPARPAREAGARRHAKATK